MNKEKYRELDKRITKQVMAEFKGKVVEHDCPDCKGNNRNCENCGGSGTIKIRY